MGGEPAALTRSVTGMAEPAQTDLSILRLGGPGGDYTNKYHTCSVVELGITVPFVSKVVCRLVILMTQRNKLTSGLQLSRLLIGR